MKTFQRTIPWFVKGILLCFIATCALGVWLRWYMAGHGHLGSFSFAHLRHAHSHLGYFGVLFPLLFLVWHHEEQFSLGPKGRYIYSAAVLLSFVGFARAGYKLDAIIGCTVVGGIWLLAAWKQRKWSALLQRDWSALIAPGIILASCCIPPIAVLTRRKPIVAQQLVQTYLSGLLFLVAIPTISQRLKIPAPHAGAWFMSGLAAALFVGLIPHAFTGVGLIAMALMFQWQITKMPADSLSKRGSKLVVHMWQLWTLGALAIGLQILPNQHHVAIAGLHFMLLGPVMLSVWFCFAPNTMTPWLTLPYAALVLCMSGAIAMQQYQSHPRWTITTAATGTGIALLLIFWCVYAVKTHRHTASRPAD